jgi:hypothetical protein
MRTAEIMTTASSAESPKIDRRIVAGETTI